MKYYGESNLNDLLTVNKTQEEIQSAITTELDPGTGKLQAKLVSGTNIKTINNQSILGSGNIDIQGGGFSIPTITISVDQKINDDPVIVQFTDAQAAIIENINNNIIKLDASALNMGIGFFNNIIADDNHYELVNHAATFPINSQLNINPNMAMGLMDLVVVYTVNNKQGTYSIFEINPDTKTSVMTQAVGIDSNGRFWTTPSSGLPDPSEMEDGTAMVVTDGKWVEQTGYAYTAEEQVEFINAETYFYYIGTEHQGYNFACATGYTQDIYDTITKGKTYTVVWAGTEYVCDAQNVNGTLGFGNMTYIGGAGNNEPFAYVKAFSTGEGSVEDCWIDLTATASRRVTFSCTGPYPVTYPFSNDLINIYGSYNSDNYWTGLSIGDDNKNISCVKGVNDGTNWTSLTVNGTTKNIPVGLTNLVDGRYYSTKSTYAIDAWGQGTMAEGYKTTAFSDGAHAEGIGSAVPMIETESSQGAHAEGISRGAIGRGAHAEGIGAYTATGITVSNDVTESNTIQYNAGSNRCFENGDKIVFENAGTIYEVTDASAEWSIVINTAVTVTRGTVITKVAALGSGAHAEGSRTFANGEGSHAEGIHTRANAMFASHVEGYYTRATANYQHVQGKYNVTNNNYADIVGNGEEDYSRSNASALDWNGNLRLHGDVYVNCNDDSSGGTQLLPIPTCPTTTDGTYVLQCVISSGQPTYSWVQQPLAAGNDF